MIDPRWRDVNRVLAVRLDNLGDVLVTTPAIRAIRQSLPAAHITLLASPVGAQAGRLNPDIDDVIVYDAPWMDAWHELPLDPAREQQTIECLSKGRFDGAIIFTSFRQSPLPAAYLCYLAGIPLRAAASIDGPGSLLTTRHKHPERIMHEVERGLDLVGAIGLETDDHDLVLETSEDASALISGSDRPVVVVHPGCSMPARTYPWEMYAKVCDLLIERLDTRVFLTGGPGERELAEQVRGRMRHGAVNVAGEIPFPEFVALIKGADLTVANNTGPMHVAAAVKTPVIALFALTNPPEQWGPWRVPHRQLFHDVPCRICYSRVCPYNHECLTLVSPEMVVDAASELFAETMARRPVAIGANQ
ncbi:glycosyltransferase family 9 protein [soil metagenome]